MKTILRSVRALFLIALGIFVLYEYYPFAKVFHAQSAQAEGTVVQVLREGWSRNHGHVVTRDVKIVFTTDSGKAAYLTQCLYEEKARAANVGKKLPVRYDPHDPGNSNVGTVGELFVYIYGGYAVGGGLVIAGVFLLFRIRPTACSENAA